MVSEDCEDKIMKTRTQIKMTDRHVLLQNQKVELGHFSSEYEKKTEINYGSERQLTAIIWL